MLSGAVAHLGERLLCTQEAVGSIPSSSTTFSLKFLRDKSAAEKVQLEDRFFPREGTRQGFVNSNRCRTGTFQEALYGTEMSSFTIE